MMEAVVKDRTQLADFGDPDAGDAPGAIVSGCTPQYACSTSKGQISRVTTLHGRLLPLLRGHLIGPVLLER